MELIKIRNFRFVDRDADPTEQHEQVVAIPEVMDPSYGMYVWPCAPVLAQYIWSRRYFVREKNVLEIGAGTALPGILASLCGAKVTLSDGIHLNNCIENCRRSCKVNNVGEIPVIGITWGLITDSLRNLLPVDIILGSDCFYDPDDFEDVIATVAYLLRKCPEARFWCTYQLRSIDWTISDLLFKWHLKYESIPLSEFGADTEDIAESGLPGCSAVEMMEIRNEAPRKL